jgi:hypothetical protein
MRPDRTSSGWLPGVITTRCSGTVACPFETLRIVRAAVPLGDALRAAGRLTPFGAAASRAGCPAAGSFLALALALAFDLALFDFDLADLPLGLSAFSALAAFFAVLPLPVLPLAALVGAANLCETAAGRAVP